MKQLLLLIAAFLTFSAQAQTPGWTSVQAVEQPNGLMDIATDQSGNYYVTGRFYDAITLGNTRITASGLCVYVAKCRPSGEVIQVTKLLGSSDAIPFGVAIDASGQAYVTGTFRGSLSAKSGQSITSKSTFDGQPQQDVFVLKCGQDGAVQWLRQISSTQPYYYYYSSNVGQNIAVDKAGNSYVTGTISGTTVQFDAKTAFSDRYNQAFLASYSPTGELRWARVMEGLIPQGSEFTPGSTSSGGAVVVHQSGDVYLSGSQYDAWQLDGITVRSADNNSNMYLARFEAKKGGLMWATSVPGTGDGRSLALAGKDELYLANSYYGTVHFGSSTLTSKGRTDIYIAHYNDTGRALSAVSLGTANGDYPGGIQADASSGKVFLTGAFNLSNDYPYTSQAFLTELQPRTGALKTELVGGPGTSSGAKLALDKHNNIYTIGIFTGTNQFGPITISSTFTEGYLARYGSQLSRSVSGQSDVAISVYPNPAQSHFVLTLENAGINSAIRATLYNSFGRVVAEQKAISAGQKLEARFNTSSLPKGIYVLRLEYNKEVINRTITVE
ncbi:hypothetical protein GCM10027346_25360 [Hymenobacter seoulensis]